MFLIDPGKRQQAPAEAGAGPGNPVRQHEQRPQCQSKRCQFDRRIEVADRLSAVTAPTKRREPTDYGYQISQGEPALTVLASRPGDDRGPSSRQSLDKNADEAANEWCSREEENGRKEWQRHRRRR